MGDLQAEATGWTCCNCHIVLPQRDGAGAAFDTKAVTIKKPKETQEDPNQGFFERLKI